MLAGLAVILWKRQLSIWELSRLWTISGFLMLLALFHKLSCLASPGETLHGAWHGTVVDLWINKISITWKQGSYIIDKELENSKQKYRVSLFGWRILVKDTKLEPAEITFCKFCHCHVEFSEQQELRLLCNPCPAHWRCLSNSWGFSKCYLTVITFSALMAINDSSSE